MGAFVKLIDALLFLFFLLMAVVAPLIDAQTCLPLNFFPALLINLKESYSRDFGDYLVSEKPQFFVAFVWLELLFLWPLSLVNLFGILGAKSWFNTTCLIYGVSVSTSMVAILGELMGSGRASDKLLMVYYPCLGFGALAVLRGLYPNSGKVAPTLGKRSVLGRKKKA